MPLPTHYQPVHETGDRSETQKPPQPLPAKKVLAKTTMCVPYLAYLCPYATPFVEINQPSSQKNHPSHAFLHKNLVDTPKPNPVRSEALMAAVDGLDVDLVEGQIT